MRTLESIRDIDQEKVIYAPTTQSYLIIAPPGNGKTYTMSKRISYLIQNKLIPTDKKILGLTFSNAAANEMYNKLTISDKQKDESVEIFTFHSLCYNVLRAFGNKIGLSVNFDIIWDDEKDQILLKISDNRLKKKTPIYNSYRIWIRERFLRLNSTYVDENNNHLFEKVYKVYKIKLEESNKIDFNEMLLQTINLWNKYPDILEFYRQKYAYILVDEFQDTNYLQYEILSKLILGVNSTRKISFMCFGDPYQSIYMFQGALANHISRAKIKFNVKEKILGTNHRNEIQFIQALDRYLRDGIDPDYSTFPKIPYYRFVNQELETDFIISEIMKIPKEIKLHEICVISRAYWRLSLIKKRLDERKIEYIFLDDFRRENIEKEYKFLFDLFTEHIRKRTTLGSISELLLQACKKEKREINEDLVLRVLYSYFSEFEELEHIEQISLWEKLIFLKNDISLRMNWGAIVKKQVTNKVFLSSIHQVKGLEFKNVYMVGTENFNPISMCKPCFKGGKQDIDEEFNILYVGITRTKANLTFTSVEIMRNKAGELKKRNISCLFHRINGFFDFINYKTKSHLSYQAIKCFKLTD